MKPENAIVGNVSADLTCVSFEDALIKLKCFPICTLVISEQNLFEAQRIVSQLSPIDKVAVGPRVHILIDPNYGPDEWSVEYNGNIFWSSGA